MSRCVSYDRARNALPLSPVKTGLVARLARVTRTRIPERAACRNDPGGHQAQVPGIDQRNFAYSRRSARIAKRIKTVMQDPAWPCLLAKRSRVGAAIAERPVSVKTASAAARGRYVRASPQTSPLSMTWFTSICLSRLLGVAGRHGESAGYCHFRGAESQPDLRSARSLQENQFIRWGYRLRSGPHPPPSPSPPALGPHGCGRGVAEAASLPHRCPFWAGCPCGLQPSSRIVPPRGELSAFSWRVVGLRVEICLSWRVFSK